MLLLELEEPLSKILAIEILPLLKKRMIFRLWEKAMPASALERLSLRKLPMKEWKSVEKLVEDMDFLTILASLLFFANMPPTLL